MAYRWWSAGDPDYAPEPYPIAIGYPAHAEANGLLWLFGGWDSTFTARTEVRTFDPAANAWTTRTAMGAAVVFDGPGAAIIGTNAYLAGGSGFYRYNLDTGAWLQLADPIGGNSTGWDPAALDGKIYHKLDSATDPCVFDPDTGTWTALTPWPTRVAEGGFGAGFNVVVGSLIYCYWKGFLATYDPATDSWTDLTSHASARAVQRANFVNISGVLHISGGDELATGNTSVLHSSYDIATDTWAIETDTPTAREGHALLAANDRMFAIGGEDSGGSYLSSHDMWAETQPAPSADLEVSYDTPVSADLEVEYAVPAVADLEVAYSTRGEVQADLNVTYDVPANLNANASLQVQYRTGRTARDRLLVSYDQINPHSTHTYVDLAISGS